jgi:hypothetical protein
MVIFDLYRELAAEKALNMQTFKSGEMTETAKTVLRMCNRDL